MISDFEALRVTDPEFMALWDHFALDEVIHHGDLDDRTRFLAILSALIGCQGLDAFRVMLPAALNAGLPPVEVKELVYQAAAYLGFGRVYPFLLAANKVQAGNCFGDYYTRTGLNLKDRELITFCFIAAQGGCEPQLTSHAKGNFNMGNDKEMLI